MAMPRQLANGLWKRRQSRDKHQEPRPIAELLPKINVNDLKIPKNYPTVTAPWISLRYPFLNAIKMNCHVVEFSHSERVQSVRLKHIKTYFGLPRFAFICQCGRPVISLYLRYGNLACRRCSNSIYASQACNQNKRPTLQAHRLHQFIKFTRIPHKTKQKLKARSKPRKHRISPRLPKHITAKALLPQGKYSTHAKIYWR